MLVNSGEPMTYTPLKPPEGLAEELVETFESSTPEHLRKIARYLDSLAEYREREKRLSKGTDEAREGIGNVHKDTAETRKGIAEARKGADKTQTEDAREELPEGVPQKATLTIKEINDNRYYYWQWREGDAVKSKYKGPVDRDG